MRKSKSNQIKKKTMSNIATVSSLSQRKMIQQIREEAAASQSTTHYIEFDVSSQVKREMEKPNKNL